MGVAAQTANLKTEVLRIERVTKRRRGLRWTLEGEHALRPGVASELVGLLARLGPRAWPPRGPRCRKVYREIWCP